MHFGVPFPDVPTSPTSHLPYAAEVLAALVRRHVAEEGIFRVPGGAENCQALRAALEQGYAKGEGEGGEEAGAEASLSPQAIAQAAGLDPASPTTGHVAASVLKMWLRELPQGGRLLSNVDADLGKRGVPDEALEELVRGLEPAPVRPATLQLVLNLGREVVAHAAVNRMSAQAYAICVAPALFDDYDLTNPDVMEKVKDERTLLQRLLAWYAAK